MKKKSQDRLLHKCRMCDFSKTPLKSTLLTEFIARNIIFRRLSKLASKKETKPVYLSNGAKMITDLGGRFSIPGIEV